MKLTIQQQQAQKREQTQESFKLQQATFDTTVQKLIDQLKLTNNSQGTSSLLNTAVATRGVKPSSVSRPTGK
eukprot:5921337-Ditylum_brightwellii.AAC.1